MYCRSHVYCQAIRAPPPHLDMFELFHMQRLTANSPSPAPHRAVLLLVVTVLQDPRVPYSRGMNPARAGTNHTKNTCRRIDPCRAVYY